MWLECHIKFPKKCNLVWINVKLHGKHCAAVISHKKHLPALSQENIPTANPTLFGEVFTSIKNRYDSIIQPEG